MQFRLFSLSYLNWRIFANLARVVVDRGLTTPVWPIQQQEEEAATVIDSCNPLTLFLYNSQCINISLSCRLLGKQSRIFLISEYERPVLEESLSCWLLGKHHYDIKYFMHDFMYTFRSRIELMKISKKVFWLKRQNSKISKRQNPKSPKLQNSKTPKPQNPNSQNPKTPNLKTPKPQNLPKSQLSIQKRSKTIKPQRSKTGLLKSVCK